MIDARGKVHSIFAEKSTADKATEEEIILQFYNSVYQPGEINGRAVNSEMYIEVET
ncbi:hypothetical protein [Noviherbaspirillum sedimenti]|uniref:hypothetical protein n=1 Tax=Noviherbaspirillum sedimenti TaxID=2320865 RepID=UPI00131425F1|nr:hypothetical protein [Noviherbaspirillum sedimenti]